MTAEKEKKSRRMLATKETARAVRQSVVDVYRTFEGGTVDPLFAPIFEFLDAVIARLPTEASLLADDARRAERRKKSTSDKENKPCPTP